MRLRSTLVVLALFLAGALFLPRGHAAPEQGWSLAARVPATALGYIAAEDVGSWGARFEKTAIHKLFTHPDMEAFLAPVMQGLEKMMEGRGGPMSEMPPPVRELLGQLQHLHGDVAVAVLDIDQTSGVPAVIASLDFGGHAADFALFMQRFRKEVDPEGQHIQESVRDGRPYWTADADGMPITATIFDSAFIVSNSEDALNAAISGEVESTLADSATYAKTRTQAGGDDLAFFLYANMPPITEMLKGQMGEQGTMMANMFGLDTIHGLAFGIAFAGDGFRDSFILHAPNADHGYLSLLRYEPYQSEALKWVPANAFYYAEGKANLDEYVGKMMDFVSGIDPNATAQAKEFLQQLNSQLGIDIDKDFVQQLDGHTCMYAGLPATGGLYPEVALLLKAKDGAAFEASMTRLVDGFAGMLTEGGKALANPRTMKFRDHTLHLLDLEGPRRKKMIPFTPTWARISDNWFAITLVPHSMKELLLRMGTTGEPGLAAQEDFQAVMAHKPAGTGSVGYLDLQAVFTLLYDTGVPLLQTIAKPNMMPEGFPPLDFAQLPPTRSIQPYMRSMGLFVTWNDDGLSLSTHGPLPMGVVLVAAIGAAVAVPMMIGRTSRMEIPMEAPRGERPPRSSRLKQVQRDVAEMQARDLARHVRSYMLEHAALPSSLQELVDKELVRAIPHDPWGHPFKLVVTDAAKKEFKLLSSGPDGQKGTADDILIDG